KNGKLAQMSDIMCPTDWDLSGFKEMMIPHLKKDELEWKFYDDLVSDWNSKYEGQPLSKFLEFMLNQVELYLKVQ
ncbi:MAG: YkgJ family cysteine cluster protein, partial [Nitrosopumilus sp.]